tara:strand:- start:102 stop:215 length:114 start_codon:yes stop_codon:yes gene_type:complete
MKPYGSTIILYYLIKENETLKDELAEIKNILLSNNIK